MIEYKPLSFRYYSSREGDPDWEELNQQAFELAREIAPNLHKDFEDTSQDRVADRIRKARSLSTALSNYFINRRRFKQGNWALRPLYFIWTMLYTCNFRCIYCDDHRGKAYYEYEDNSLSFEDKVRVLKIMRTGTSAVYFCGGEPTLVKELPELTEIAFNLGYHPLMINTNAYIFHKVLKQPRWYKWLRYMDTIIVSIDGLNLERLCHLWGVKKVEQVFVNLLMLRYLRQVVDFKLAVNTVIVEEGVEEAGAVLDFINDLGDVWFVPVPVNYHGEKEKGGFTFEKDMLHRSDYQALAKKILERKKQGALLIGSPRILEMLVYCKPYVCLPTLRPHIDPDGRIAWPCRAPINLKPIYVNLLEFENLDQCWQEAQSQKSATNFHGPGPEQCGTNCAWMQNYTTARYYEFLTDPLHSGVVSEIKEFAYQSG